METGIIKKIEEWLKPKLEADSLFLVEIKAHGKKIEVFIDGIENVTIDKCAETSKFLDEYLDGEEFISQEYLLEVSSPGMFSPIRVLPQYVKRIGKELEIVMKDGEKIEGVLKKVEEGELELEISTPIKKTKKVEIEIERIKIEEIKKAIVKFKF